MVVEFASSLEWLIPYFAIPAHFWQYRTGGMALFRALQETRNLSG